MTGSGEQVRQVAGRPAASVEQVGPEAGGRPEVRVPTVADENDPLDGVPAAVRDATDGYDRDTAGGCG